MPCGVNVGEGPGALIVLTFSNSAWNDFLTNWVVFARKAGVTKFLVGALDQPTFQFCKAQGLYAWPTYDEGLLQLINGVAGEGLSHFPLFAPLGDSSTGAHGGLCGRR